jgi:hypothetical protein
LVDLGLEIGGQLKQLYEIKSSSDLQSIYTGIGQLMFHSGGGPDVVKFLVLPGEELTTEIVKVLNSFEIDLLRYTIHSGKVKFLT